MSTEFIPCTQRLLHPAEWVSAAATAIEENPANRAPVERLHRLIDFVLLPAHIALLTTKYWGAGGVKLGVYFMDTKEAALKVRLLSHMNAWSKYANVQFAEVSSSAAEVRIARTPGGGYWSYLGTDILHIPAAEPTMNLDSFDMNTPESEYHRVVRHETGHALGFVHEHLRRAIVERLDPGKTISYFEQTQGWSAEEVQQQVLIPEEEATLMATPETDVLSIMCYQLPGSITVDGQPIPGGDDIDPSDGAFAGKLYPLAETPEPPPPPAVHKLYDLDFTRMGGRKKGQAWQSVAKVDIPAGKCSLVYPALSDTAALDQSPHAE